MGFVNPFSMIQVGRAALSPGKPRGKRPSTRASIGSRRGSTHRIFHSETGSFIDTDCVRIAANRAKLSSVCKGFIGFFGGGFVPPPLSFFSFLDERKEGKRKSRRPRAMPTLPWCEYACRGEKYFALTEALQSKHK